MWVYNEIRDGPISRREGEQWVRAERGWVISFWALEKVWVMY